MYSDDNAEGQSRLRGKYKWWERPWVILSISIVHHLVFRIYVAPHVHPLDEGTDFSFLGELHEGGDDVWTIDTFLYIGILLRSIIISILSDGRPSPLATKAKIERKLEQIQLGVSVFLQNNMYLYFDRISANDC